MAPKNWNEPDQHQLPALLGGQGQRVFRYQERRFAVDARKDTHNKSKNKKFHRDVPFQLRAAQPGGR